MSEPEIRKEAGNQVSIALAGIKDPKAAASIIGSTGQLYMLDYTGTLEPIVSKSATGTASYRPTLYALLNAAKNRPNTHPYDGATPERWYAFDKKTHKRVLNSIGQPFPPGASKKQLLADLKGKADGAVLLRSPAGTVWADDQIDSTTGNVNDTQHRFVMFRMPNDKNMVVFGRDVRNAKSDYDPQSGPDVTMGFSSTGTKAFKNITNELAERGRLTQNTEVPFAVILDNKIEATPTISLPAHARRHRRQRADHGALDRRGEPHRARAAVGLAAGLVQHALAVAGLGDARQGLAAPGADRGHHRPARRDDLSASSSTGCWVWSPTSRC